MNRTPLPSAVASNLLWAAAVLDAVIIFTAVQVLEPLVLALLELGLPGFTRDFTTLDPAISTALGVLLTVLSFIVLLVLYWLVTEVVFAGRTIGRLILGMRLRQQNGEKPRRLQVTKRGLRKISTLGLSGLAIGSLDRYDRNNGLIWTSPMVEGALSASRNLKVEVLSGASAGTSHVLEQLPNFRRHRGIQIGREQSWADILLDRDGNVSNKHALVRLRPSGWQIMDYGGGKGSSNKTKVKGRALTPGKWYPLAVNEPFFVADVKIQITK